MVCLFFCFYKKCFWKKNILVFYQKYFSYPHLSRYHWHRLLHCLRGTRLPWASLSCNHSCREMAESFRNTTGYTLSGHITETLKPHIIFVNFVWRSPSSGQTLINTHWKKVQDKGLGAPCREKPLEKSGLEPAAPNRLADRKHCALSTHPNPHLHTLVCLFCLYMLAPEAGQAPSRPSAYSRPSPSPYSRPWPSSGQPAPIAGHDPVAGHGPIDGHDGRPD